MSEDKKSSNEFRIGFKSNPKEVITECVNILKNDKNKELHLLAISSSIGEISIISEILKSIFPNLSQKNVFSVIYPFSKKKERNEEYKNRLYPKLEIILSLDEKKKGSATKISEEEIKLLLILMKSKRNPLEKAGNPINLLEEIEDGIIQLIQDIHMLLKGLFLILEDHLEKVLLEEG